MSENQDKALALIPKVSGPLSILGSCWILWDIVGNTSKKKWTKPYHRLLMSMCIMDVLSSTCLALSTWPIPSDSDRWGASGNDATCKAQAFFIQANISSPIFNFMLSLFFLLKIQYRYTDQQLSKSIEPAMQIFTLVFGLGTSSYCLGMDLFADSSLWCWINATPKGCQQTFQLDDSQETTTCVTGDNAGIYRWAFFFAPLWASAIGSMIIMGMLYRYVRQTEKNTNSYDFELAFAKSVVQQQQQQETGADLTGRENDNNVDVDDDDDYDCGDDDDDYKYAIQRQQQNVSDSCELSLSCSSSAVSNTRRSGCSGSAGSAALSVKYVSRNVSTTVNEMWTKRKQIRRRKSENRKREFRKSKVVAHQAYRYVAVFYITWIAGTINRLLQLINGKSFYWIMVLHAIFTPLQGFFNWLVYMYPKWQKQKKKRRQKQRQSMRSSNMMMNHHQSNYGTHGNKHSSKGLTGMGFSSAGRKRNSSTASHHQQHHPLMDTSTTTRTTRTEMSSVYMSLRNSVGIPNLMNLRMSFNNAAATPATPAPPCSASPPAPEENHEVDDNGAPTTDVVVSGLAAYDATPSSIIIQEEPSSSPSPPPLPTTTTVTTELDPVEETSSCSKNQPLVEEVEEEDPIIRRSSSPSLRMIVPDHRNGKMPYVADSDDENDISSTKDDKKDSSLTPSLRESEVFDLQGVSRILEIGHA